MSAKATYCVCRNTYRIGGCDAFDDNIPNCPQLRKDVWEHEIGDISNKNNN